MLKKTVTYKDYNGIERTEDHFFNMNEAEIAKMEMSVNGGLTTHLRRVLAAQDQVAIIDLVDDLLKRSYGVKSIDGRKFEKSEAIWNEFKNTEAYSIIFMEVAFNAEKASEFVNGILPADLAEKVKGMSKEQLEEIVANQ